MTTGLPAPRALQRIGIVLLTIAAALLLARPVLQLPDHLARDFNEGWNALQAERVADGETLYPPYDSLTANIYPPLSFYLVAPTGELLGDHLLAGRLIALLSLLVSAAAVGSIVRTITSSQTAALVGSLTTVVYFGARHGGYVATDDPQWLGHALMLSGVACLLRARSPGPLFYWSCALLVAGGFVKHTLLPAPLAATLWVLTERTRWLPHWLIGAVTLIAAGLVLASFAYGPDFIAQLFGGSRTYSVRHMVAGIDRWFTPMLPLVIMGGVALPVLLRSSPGRFVIFYALLSMAWGALLLLGNGVDHNAVFDAALALCIAVGTLAHETASDPLRPGDGSRTRAGLVALTVLATVAPRLPHAAGDLWLYATQRSSLEAISLADIEFVKSSEGPVACENLAICYWAGKGFQFDFFHSGEKIASGVFTTEKVSGLFSSRVFRLVQVENQDGTSVRVPRAVIDALHDHYTLVRSSEVSGNFYVPRAADEL